MSAQNQKLADGQSWFAATRAGRIAVYERAWHNRIAGVRACLDRGGTMTEVLHVYENESSAYKGFIPNFITNSLLRIDLGEFCHEKPPRRLSVVDGRYVSSISSPSVGILIDDVARCIEPDVDCIVEFGSGLGFNLARLRLRLPNAPLTYIACEPSEAGREVTRRLFATDPATRLQDYSFDYVQPNLDFLRGFRKIIAFTVHSVEQIPVLGEDFYRMLLNTNVAACIHIEPVGWQRFTNIAAVVLAMHRDKGTWHQCLRNYVCEINDAHVVGNAAMWSAICGYNTDLLRLVATTAASGEITVTSLAYEVIGSNPFNPSSLVAWRRTRS